MLSSASPSHRLHTRPSPSQELDLRSTIRALQLEVEALGIGPCTVRVTRRRGWPDPQPVTEIVVRAGDVTTLTRHADPQLAAIRAFQSVLDRLG